MTATPVLDQPSPGKYVAYAVSWDGRLRKLDVATGNEIEPPSLFVPPNGKPYALNYAYTVFGMWYDSAAFQKNGWTVPKTWAEFTALADKLKAAGITPYAYAGANAAYYQYLVILTSAAKIGGADILKNIDNLEDGAWKNDAVKKAAAAWAEIGAKYMNKAHLGQKHTEVQLQHN